MSSEMSLPVGWPADTAEQSLTLRVSLSSSHHRFSLLHSLQSCWNLIMNQIYTFFCQLWLNFSHGYKSSPGKENDVIANSVII